MWIFRVQRSDPSDARDISGIAVGCSAFDVSVRLE